MSPSLPTEAGRGRPPRRAVLAVALFLALHVALALWRPARFWGVSFLAYLPTTAGVAFALLATLMLVPRARMAGGAALGRVLGDTDPWAPGRRAVAFWAVLLLGALGLFVACRSAVHLLGDGYLYIREMDRDAWAMGPRSDRAPLTFWLLRLIHNAGRSVWGGGETTYRILTTASGVVYLGLAGGLSGLLGRTRGERGVVFALLATGGFLQLFFGYVENYAFFLVALTAYLIVALLALRGSVTPWLPALLLALFLPLHFAFFAFLPALVVVLWARAPLGERLPSRIAASLLGLVGVVAAAAGILRATGFKPLAALRGIHASHLLPVFAAPNQAQHYRLFSLGHGLDLANELLLVAPAALLVLIAFGGRPWLRDTRAVFLGLTALGGLGLGAVLNPEVGVFRDWDVLAVLVFPVLPWAGLWFVRARARGRVQTGALIMLAVALHSALWIGVNAGGAGASDRFRGILDGAPLSRHARSYGWETLGTYYDRVGRKDEAFQAFEKAMEASGGNPRHYVSIGALHLEAGRIPEAIVAYEEAVRKAPERADANLGLGRALLRAGRLSEAAPYVERAVTLAPLDPQCWFERGNLRFDLGRLPEAMEDYRQALSLRPEFLEAWLNLASCLYSSKRYEEAIQTADKALRRQADLPDGLYIQGASYWELGRRDEARAKFLRLLQVDPSHKQAARVRKLLGL